MDAVIGALSEMRKRTQNKKSKCNDGRELFGKDHARNADWRCSSVDDLLIFLKKKTAPVTETGACMKRGMAHAWRYPLQV